MSKLNSINKKNIRPFIIIFLCVKAALATFLIFSAVDSIATCCLMLFAEAAILIAVFINFEKTTDREFFKNTDANTNLSSFDDDLRYDIEFRHYPGNIHHTDN